MNYRDTQRLVDSGFVPLRGAACASYPQKILGISEIDRGSYHIGAGGSGRIDCPELEVGFCDFSSAGI